MKYLKYVVVTLYLPMLIIGYLLLTDKPTNKDFIEFLEFVYTGEI